jgi:20S proteasome subunit beta 5
MYRKLDQDKVLKFCHGTTTLAFICRAGIIISVDSRASIGNFIGSPGVKKILEINSYLLGTMAGGAADCFFWERNLSSLCKLYEIKNNSKVSVSGASKILANSIFKYKNSGISMGTMIIGWDINGPSIYYIDSDGNRLKVSMVAVGSGSTFAYGILDSGYKWDLEIEEACELSRRAIFEASCKDPFSGGNVNTYIVRKNGWVKVSFDDIGTLADFAYRK